MDAIKLEPESEGETNVSHVNNQESDCQEEGVRQYFAFVKVKVEVVVRTGNFLSSAPHLSLAPGINLILCRPDGPSIKYPQFPAILNALNFQPRNLLLIKV